MKEIADLKKEVSASPLYSEGLAPVPLNKRTWSLWDLAAIWVGMAVCIPTYILASYMIKSGVSWQVALIIIGLANLIITIPMVLNGHAGVKYGIPFPVIGRASFGIKGIHIASLVRAIVACGWFGVQTWIGGLAIYAIWKALTGEAFNPGLDAGKFIGFAVFWLINMYFIWKGTESIKWLEKFAAPILILIGILLIIWGSYQAGGFDIVLEKGKQLEKPTASITQKGNEFLLHLSSLKNKEGKFKASEYQLTYPVAESSEKSDWVPVTEESIPVETQQNAIVPASLENGGKQLTVQFRSLDRDNNYIYSSKVSVPFRQGNKDFGATLWGYILWLTAMVGFWATMSLSIADITRYTDSQKAQVAGQFLGLPGTMILYSFVGIFVTFSAIVNFNDILIAEDAPWDPVSFLARFESPLVVVVSQLFMLIATLSTNIAANVIAPANAFSNLWPKRINFQKGGLVTGIIGIIICPWWLLDEISNILIFVSGLLGPVLGILLCDYYLVRRKEMKLIELYKTNGIYAYGGTGFNAAAMIALASGVLTALVGYWIPALGFLYNLSWFTGFLVSFVIYYFLMEGRNLSYK